MKKRTIAALVAGMMVTLSGLNKGLDIVMEAQAKEMATLEAARKIAKKKKTEEVKIKIKPAAWKEATGMDKPMTWEEAMKQIGVLSKRDAKIRKVKKEIEEEIADLSSEDMNSISKNIIRVVNNKERVKKCLLMCKRLKVLMMEKLKIGAI